MKQTSSAPPFSVLLGLAFVSFAVLLLEIAWMRVLSVTLWYHFAFFALSSALFGFGASGVTLSLRFVSRVPSERFANFAAAATPAAFVLGFIGSNAIPFEPVSLAGEPIQWVYLAVFFGCTALPFFFAGLTVACKTAQYAEHFHLLYPADLLGAALGAVSAALLLPLFGGSGTLLVAAAASAFGAAFLLRKKKSNLRAPVAAAVAGIALSIAAVYGDRLIPVRISSDKVTGDGVPLGELFKDPTHHLHTAWNTTSRVDAVEWRDAKNRPLRAIFLDGGAALTRLIRVDRPLNSLPLGIDEESFFYQLFNTPRSLVVGSGGGREVLLALRNRASKIDAVEINPEINRLVKGPMASFIGHVFEAKPVTLFTDEARGFLERSDETYDIIHCPHTISNAALASGSLALSENYLLTVEAFRGYLSHLSKDGVLLITRPEAQLPRLIATLRAAAEEFYRGPDAISRRLIAWRARGTGSSFYAGIAFRKAPFTAEESAAFQNKADRRRLDTLHRPGIDSREPYQSLTRGIPVEQIALAQSTILTPSTDDKPFFNRRVPLSNLTARDILNVFSSRKRSRDALEDRPVTEAALAALLLETAFLGVLVLIVPSLLLRRRTGRALPGGGAAAFLFLGFAYIFVEIGFVQRLSLYLGRPTIVFSTVFCALLAASGTGSLVAGRYLSKISPKIFAAVAAVSTVVALLAALPLVHFTLTAPLALRIALAALLVVIPGFFMGMPFPSLIRNLGRTAPERVPLAWGINGFASTVATILAVLIAMTLGQTALLLAGTVTYLMAAACTSRK